MFAIFVHKLCVGGDDDDSGVVGIQYNNGVNTPLQPQQTPKVSAAPRTHVFPLPHYWVLKTILRNLLLPCFTFF